MVLVDWTRIDDVNLRVCRWPQSQTSDAAKPTYAS